ncbi:MAG: hypothetical protein VKJ66_10835 [Synechococcus sp.]|nr:hypothetical protein [Synechococcus sp.]
MPDSLSLNRQFTVEMHSRAIDHCSDVEELRAMAKSLLAMWQMQAEFSQHFGAQALGLGKAV